jgi:hypothetical protein
VIHALYTAEVERFPYERAVLAVALDPKFNKKSNRQFACGGKGEQLLLNSKGTFYRNLLDFLFFGNNSVAAHASSRFK